jgi:CheY-like chemotaxis protein
VGRTILVVEDDEDLRGVMADVLADEGYDVLGAAEGGEALRLLRGGAPVELILLDLVMPGMDGPAFRAAQLADPVIAGIPVVLLTAGGERRPVELADLHCLRKPVELDHLTRTVAAVLGGGSGSPQGGPTVPAGSGRGRCRTA